MKRHSNGDSGDKCELFCNLSGKKMPLPHFWDHMVGSDHATLALRADWQRRLWQCHEELGFRHVRFHRVLCDDVGTVVEEQGKRLYSFFNLDQIFDFLLSIGIKPFVKLSFMPKALASGKTTVFHYNANVTPAAEYDDWDELIDKLAAHLVQRYGANSLRDWFFEVWNEPSMKSFWTGTQEEYFKLYRHTAKALKAVDNSLKVGGAVTAKNQWIEEFLDFCQKTSLLSISSAQAGLLHGVEQFVESQVSSPARPGTGFRSAITASLRDQSW
jgi:xylan 1,4-beta-xylosidase